jgi:hypothetical protein
MKSLFELALVMFLFIVGAFAVSYGAGAAVAIGGGIRDALDQTDATRWYTDGRAQIKAYVPPPNDCPADPNLFCEDPQPSDRFLGPVYEAGLNGGAPLWNELMNNGLARLVMPFVLGVLATAMITKAVNKVFD